MGVADYLEQAKQSLQEGRLLQAAEALTAAGMASTDTQITQRAVEFNFDMGFDALAEQAAQRWVALDPSNPLVWELLGRLKMRRYAVGESAADFALALGMGEPRRDEVYVALGADLAGEGNGEQVTRVLARLVGEDALAPGGQLALGAAALRSKDYALALGAAEAAAEDQPDWTEPQLLLAQSLSAAGRHAEALAAVAALAAASPNPLIDLEFAQLLADAGEGAAARDKLQALKLQFGPRPAIERARAFLALAQGDLDEADRVLEALSTAGAERFEVFYFRGLIRVQRGATGDAQRFFARISSGSYLWPAQKALTDLLVAAGAMAEAEEKLSLFGRDHPTLGFQVLEYRAQLMERLERPEEALALYGEALQYKPAALSVRLSRGGVLERQGRLQEAQRELVAALELAPADPLAMNALGYLLADRLGQTRTAWGYVRRAYEIQPENPAIQDSLGWTLFKLGRLEEARSHLEEALGRWPDPEIASHLARVFWQLGERSQAIDLLRSAAVAFPNSQPVQAAVARLLN